MILINDGFLKQE